MYAIAFGRAIAVFLITVAGLWGSTTVAASAPQLPSPQCKKYYASVYTKKSGIGAVAAARGVSACGFAWHHFSMDTARERALEECRKLSKGRRCRIVETRGPEFSPKSASCQENYELWRRQVGFRAFAVATNGQVCGWTSKSLSKAAAMRDAIAGCGKYSKWCRVLFYESGTQSEATDRLVKEGEAWLNKNLIDKSASAVTELQKKLLDDKRDCGSISVDGKIGPQTLAAIGRCLVESTKDVAFAEPKSRGKQQDDSLMFRFRSIVALTDQLEIAEVHADHRSEIARELQRALRTPDLKTSAKVAYVRIDKRNGDASKEKVPLSVSIDLDDGRTLVLYPTKKADKIVYWSQGPSMNAVSSNRAATEISTGEADHNSTGDEPGSRVALNSPGTSSTAHNREIERWWDSDGRSDLEAVLRCAFDQVLPHIGIQDKNKLNQMVNKLVVENCRAEYLSLFKVAASRFGRGLAAARIKDRIDKTGSTAFAAYLKELSEVRNKAQASLSNSGKQTVDEIRIALVIGNNAYANVQALRNPANDADDMASSLKKLGFDVTLLKDGTRLQMEDQLSAFARRARKADTAVIFYAGHAIQHQGINYIIPIDASLKDEADVRRLIRVQDVIKDLQNSPVPESCFWMLVEITKLSSSWRALKV
jgi:hypothetical protein